MYMHMNIICISIHYLLFVTLCGQFCSWVNKAIIIIIIMMPKSASELYGWYLGMEF
jgi:hypothetical protein